MKKNAPQKALFVLLVIMAITTAIVVINQQTPIQRSVRTVRTVHWANPVVTRTPEFRPPPEKVYKPSMFQQMGLLTKDDGTILPLYGKESTAHRDRYNYYTTTTGNQVYSLPISHDNRDCTEDIGCGEFYGNENVSVTGMDGTFSTQIYRNKNMVLM
mgnify:CR=1 FL=1